jgi:hypothetical protein
MLTDAGTAPLPPVNLIQSAVVKAEDIELVIKKSPNCDIVVGEPSSNLDPLGVVSPPAAATI